MRQSSYNTGGIKTASELASNGSPQIPTFKDVLNAELVIQDYHKANPIPEPQVIDAMHFTDAGNAAWFVRLHGRNLRFVNQWNSWMEWDGRVWVARKTEDLTGLMIELAKQMRINADSIVNSKDADRMRQHADATESLSHMLACLKIARNFKEVQATPDDFDSGKYLINFANGTVNLDVNASDAGVLRDFRREDMMTKCSCVNFDKDATCEPFDKFMDEIFEGKTEIIKYLQTLFGMCMTGDVSQEQLFVFWGAKANNGKGTLVELISYVLTNYRVLLPVNALINTGGSSVPADIARLKGARICIANEPSHGMVLDDGKVKQITGKDPFPARFMRENFFDINPTHHTLITTNPKPIMHLTDAGMRRRVVIIGFYYTPKVPDRYLDVKLRAVASGVANWMLEGCLRWQREGLVQPKEIKDTVDDYRDEMDSMGAFFKNFIVESLNAKTIFSVLYKVYSCWAEVEEVPAESKNNFGKILVDRGFRKCTKLFENQQQRAYQGVTVPDHVLLATIQYINADYDHRDSTKANLMEMIKKMTNPFSNDDSLRVCTPELEKDMINTLKDRHGDVSKVTDENVRKYIKTCMFNFLRVHHDNDMDETEIEGVVDKYCGWEKK